MEQDPQTIYHSSANATVYSVCIVRQPSDQQLALAISVQDGDKMLRTFFLTQPQDLDNIGNLMDANQVWIEKDTESGKEFGSITLGFSGETHAEIFCDSVEELQPQQ